MVNRRNRGRGPSPCLRGERCCWCPTQSSSPQLLPVWLYGGGGCSRLDAVGILERKHSILPQLPEKGQSTGTGLGTPPERIKVTSQRASATHSTPCPELEPMPCGFPGSMAPRLCGSQVRVLESAMPAIITSRPHSRELKRQKVRFCPSKFQPGAMDRMGDLTQSPETRVTRALSSPKLTSKVPLLQQKGMVPIVRD